jgi:hypothetical protein
MVLGNKYPYSNPENVTQEEILGRKNFYRRLSCVKSTVNILLLRSPEDNIPKKFSQVEPEDAGISMPDQVGTKSSSDSESDGAVGGAEASPGQVALQNGETNALVSMKAMFEMHHLFLSKIDFFRTHLATITGRHKSYYLRIYESGKILNGNISVGHILLGSGATHASYFSKELVAKHLDIWKENITWMNGSVMIGDT